MKVYSWKRVLVFLRRPMTLLGASGLLVMGTSRLSYALTTSGALLWVYGLSTLLLGAVRQLLPRDTQVISIVLTSVVASLYLLLLYTLNPVLALSVPLLICLVPPLCVDTRICARFLHFDLKSALLRALSEALNWSLLLVSLALIREPLGEAALSLPGGPGGIIFLFGAEGSPFSLRLAASASGAFLLLGCGLSLLRRFIPGRREGETL